MTPEPGSAAAIRVAEGAGTIVVAEFAWAEVGTTLRKKVRTGALRHDAALRAWDAFVALGLEYVASPQVRARAWAIAMDHGLPTLYDAAFLAVAELAPGGPVPFWTADRRLIDAVGANYPGLHTLDAGDLSP